MPEEVSNFSRLSAITANRLAHLADKLTGGLVAAFQEAGTLARRLNAVVKNKYDSDPQKLAAWAIASHLEASPKRSKNNGSNTPTPTAPPT